MTGDEPAWHGLLAQAGICRRLKAMRKLDVQQKQGHAPFGVEMKIVDDADKPLAWDGKTFGRLMVRGPAVARAYFKEDRSVLDRDGYFDTGDVSTICPAGYMQITDRSKDVIKSGGEWISSIDLENLAVGHPKVAEAAVIGIKHPKWAERPLLIVVPKKGQSITGDEMLGFHGGQGRQMVDAGRRVIFVEEIPHTATGEDPQDGAARALQGLRTVDLTCA